MALNETSQHYPDLLEATVVVTGVDVVPPMAVAAARKQPTHTTGLMENISHEMKIHLVPRKHNFRTKVLVSHR